MEKGTILYVGNFELPDKGASANRVVSNGKIFQKLGYQMAYLGVKRGESFQGIQTLDSCRHMYEESYPHGSREWFLHMCSVRNIKEVVTKYENVRMIILYNVPYMLLLRVKSVFRHTGIKVVYDCTEWTGVTDGSIIKRTVKRVDEYFIRNKIAKMADGLIVISRRMAESYKACRHLILLPPLVDIHDPIWHQKRVREDDGFEFCFAGMLDGNKESLDSIVEAFSNMQDPKGILRIIGVTEKEFCDHYADGRNLLDKITGQIIFMGRLSHFETIKYVLSCDCYIFIRQSDMRNNAGFPTKFAEAFSCGVPIITTDISDIREYLQGDTRGQLLSSASAEDVRIAMEYVMVTDKIKKVRPLDMAFHYESYRKECQVWLEEIV